jgi:hypothetical protein
MRKIWFGIGLATLIAGPAPAQDYNKNFVECLREAGLQPDPGYAQKVQSDPGNRTLRRWYLHSEAQAAVINDCVARKASLARNSSVGRKPRGSQ